ncbi:hypothetical protein SAZ_32825 [Streptomyces noursei ZPM]|uniref:Uncharacterized protein n=1 Tax=Streptomyces noursei TaxID=1971 RepID=A0A059WA80_STRNR|nr:hypothetical protein [Streptomyces noursei]AKA08997.1 hypothetical protein SAZ_32825 [Streptomyces noursei ZPM]AIA06660.1 hypothetical protein DC74_6219 [Streptomyces noursei]EOS97462.1 hypothetical protein K530_43783 [Streptomyces noursei CCRC 11814]EXU92683.1 hypothetical protein P354_15390 [Streptomyces noursei PD-1]UWS75198.1 hypothetical protein N1H47_30565 [Streptomyces noursei]
MTGPADIRLRSIVEQSAVNLTDEAGRFNKCHLTEAVRDQLAREDLDPHIKAAALDKLAQSLVTGFGEHRNPRRRRTGTLFHPQDIVKLGTGIWVWMDRATDSDLLEWSRLSRRNRARVDLADSEVQDYVDQRIDAFRAHADVVYLGDLERVVFGWDRNDAEPPEPAGP